MNDVFAQHNIDHLSPSTINTFIANPAKCLLKLAGYYSHAGPAAWRGIGADRAISAVIANPNMNLDSAKYIAETEYNDCHKYQPDSKPDHVKKQEKYMMNCVEIAYNDLVPEYRQKNLVDIQGKITVQLEDISVPFLGYYDLLFDDCVVDLKTKSYTLKVASLADQRQVSLYAYATKTDGALAYISGKAANIIPVPEVEKHVREIRQAALALEKILSFSDDIKECCQILYPDFDHWSWSDADKENAKQIWRMN
ncbi:MAG: PD-(D/E)XK nuclease family protein [Betaproteobacteria bacterium]